MMMETLRNGSKQSSWNKPVLELSNAIFPLPLRKYTGSPRLTSFRFVVSSYVEQCFDTIPQAYVSYFVFRHRRIYMSPTLKKLSVAFANLENAMKIFEENDQIFRELLMLITKFVHLIGVTQTCMIARRKKRCNIELIVSLKQKFNLLFFITYFDY